MKHGFALLFSTLIIALSILPANGQTYTVLQNFSATEGYPDGVKPAQGFNGRLYGTYTDTESYTCGGGAFQAPLGPQTMAIYNFSESSCTAPFGGLMLANDGNFYGTIGSGGIYGLGALFRMTQDGQMTTLYSFANQGDGAGPIYAPIQAYDGNLYGTTGGTLDERTYQIVGSGIYKYDLSSAVLTPVYEFGSGEYTAAPLIQGTDENLYVTTPLSGDGSILQMTTSGVLLSTYNFTGGADGAYPWAPLMQASDGNYYGTTQQDCGYSCGYYGTIYRMTEAGIVTTIHLFGESYGGNYPQSGLTEGTDGYLYGATWGNYVGNRVVYRISKGGGDYKALYIPTDGTTYDAELLQHTNGMFYGASVYGGTNDAGTLYSLDMGLSPFITFVQPWGMIGSTALILGQDFTDATSVTFNGILATGFNVVSDTYMTAIVPAGATTGPVVVTTGQGSLTSNKRFLITAGPPGPETATEK
jgi:uncharacterized repeat protein (TIGR03803 family)